PHRLLPLLLGEGECWAGVRRTVWDWRQAEAHAGESPDGRARPLRGVAGGRWSGGRVLSVSARLRAARSSSASSGSCPSPRRTAQEGKRRRWLLSLCPWQLRFRCYCQMKLPFSLLFKTKTKKRGGLSAVLGSCPAIMTHSL
ncbi:unnamed protein product, partial [Gulo gulo]